MKPRALCAILSAAAAAAGPLESNTTSSRSRPPPPHPHPHPPHPHPHPHPHPGPHPHPHAELRPIENPTELGFDESPEAGVSCQLSNHWGFEGGQIGYECGTPSEPLSAYDCCESCAKIHNRDPNPCGIVVWNEITGCCSLYLATSGYRYRADHLATITMDPHQGGRRAKLMFGRGYFPDKYNMVTRSYKDGITPGASYSLPGPLIRLRRGVMNNVILCNDLAAEPSTECPSGPRPEGYIVPHECHNVFRDTHITNLHTHGVFIHGNRNSDDVISHEANGAKDGGRGWCISYMYDIPADHMGGTCWYHPHHHGSTALQVGGGAAGMLIVEDDADADGIPAPVMAMEELFLALQYVDVRVAASATPLHHDTILEADVDEMWLANGVSCNEGRHCGVIDVRSDEWYRLRVLLVHGHTHTVRLQMPVWFDKGRAQACSVLLLAADGVWRRQVPSSLVNSPHATSPPAPTPCAHPGTCFHMVGSARVDLAVRCPAEMGSRGEIRVQPIIPVPPDPPGDEVLVAMMRITGQGNSDSDQRGPWAVGQQTWTPKFPYYLRDLSSLAVDGSRETLKVRGRQDGYEGFVMSQQGSEDLRSFDPLTPNYVLSRSHTHEWKLSAKRHPWHLHVVHFQIQGGDGDDCGIYEQGEYYDTLGAGLPDHPCTVRFFPDVYGHQVMHCHIVAHEDEGLMGWNLIGDALPTPPPTPYPIPASPAPPLTPAPTEVGCIAWRQTANCDPHGPRQPDEDKDCGVVIAECSGFCECSPGMVAMEKNCDYGGLSCLQACADPHPAPPPPTPRPPPPHSGPQCRHDSPANACGSCPHGAESECGSGAGAPYYCYADGDPMCRKLPVANATKQTPV